MARPRVSLLWDIRLLACGPLGAPFRPNRWRNFESGFATVAAQLAPRPGRARDRVSKLQEEWIGQFVAALRQARDDGEIRADADLDQLAFEITAMLFRANFAWIMTENERVLNQARVGVRGVLDRVATPVHVARRRQKKRQR